MATLSGAANAQRACASRAADYLDFMAGNNLAAPEAITFVIQ